MRYVLRIVLSIALLGSGSLRMSSVRADDVETVASLLELVIDADEDTARKCLNTLTAKIQSREVDAKQAAAVKASLQTTLAKLLDDAKQPLHVDAALLSASWGDEKGLSAVSRLLDAGKLSSERQLQSVEALIAGGGDAAVTGAGRILAEPKSHPLSLRTAVLAALGRSEDPRVATFVLAGYANYEPELQPKAIELLTQRPAWSKTLLETIGAGKIPPAVVNANQITRLQKSSDADLKTLAVKVLGTVRTERNPQREQVVAEMRTYLTKTSGDAVRGQAVFQKVCGQCHKLHGQGQEVGPDVTSNGRASFEQLLSNVFDPSLVIGAAYQARILEIDDGRVLTGLIAEENEQRVVLKMQGGKTETVPREKIEEIHISPLSLMPEGLEKQLTPEEIADLFALITLDRPPSDPEARTIPGTPAGSKK